MNKAARHGIGIALAWAIFLFLGWTKLNAAPLSPSVYLPLLLKPSSSATVYLPIVLRSEVPSPALRRAVWLSRFDWTRAGFTPTQESLIALLNQAADAGFTDLIFQVRGQADAFYTSGLEPWSARLSGTQSTSLGRDPGWDPLDVVITTAHARGMCVHAWMNVYPVWLAPPCVQDVCEPLAPPQGVTPEHLFNRLTYSANGGYGLGWTWRAYSTITQPMTLQRGAYLWASPAVPQVQDHVVQVAADVLTRYPLDGLHLDNVRYPGPGYSFDPFTMAAYASDPLSPTVPFSVWQPEFQRAQVTHLVARLQATARAVRPDVQLSVAAWPVYIDRWGWGASSGYNDYAQDAQGWAQQGLVDGVLPMLYSALLVSDRDKWALAARDYLDNRGQAWVWPGLAVTTSSGTCVPFDEISARVALARTYGAPGIAIFSAGEIERCAYWDDFAGLR